MASKTFYLGPTSCGELRVDRGDRTTTPPMCTRRGFPIIVEIGKRTRWENSRDEPQDEGSSLAKHAGRSKRSHTSSTCLLLSFMMVSNAEWYNIIHGNQRIGNMLNHAILMDMIEPTIIDQVTRSTKCTFYKFLFVVFSEMVSFAFKKRNDARPNRHYETSN